MSRFTLTTYDWVPEFPRGLVRDLRVRWALEEAGLDYRVESVPFHERSEAHFAHQPFGQIPWLTDGELTIFETGAILLHLGERSPALMPADEGGRSDVIKWLFAALNSVEMASQTWLIFKFAEDTNVSPGRESLERFLQKRLQHMDTVLADRQWLAGSFSIADIAMSDVLRTADRFDALADFPACRAYAGRAMERPAFRKAHADQLAHFAAADAKMRKREAQAAAAPSMRLPSQV
ncbi:glutathione S-transferase family protein [Alkalicaulis satelles]|uniref:Glutathione S-transferase family protein n=1 Tax=Alkalicaulis satelles TaxID=2609175 RepID=A0A5M6ZHZ9_9PROT|nr:glutathione S-transferase family protein [Alkalicaulis satelles]KAA5804456.1 glutathione S-transferase family protein [Alkalicaulis satelles]